MAKLTVRILPRAETDFRVIYSFIEEHSPSGANRWRQAFEKKLKSVTGNPEASGFALENELTSFEFREFTFKTRRGLRYRVVFTVLDDELLIVRMRGPGQPPLADDEMSYT